MGLMVEERNPKEKVLRLFSFIILIISEIFFFVNKLRTLFNTNARQVFFSTT